MRSYEEDIAQTVLLRMLDRQRRGIVVEQNRAYIRRTAVNAVIDAVRSHMRRESMHRSSAETSANGSHHESLFTDPLLARALDERLDGLGSERRRAVSLYLAGEPVRTIAVHMGWSDKKANNTVFRSLARLRRDLAATGITPTPSTRPLPPVRSLEREALHLR